MLFTDTFHWHFSIMLFTHTFQWYFSMMLFSNTFQWFFLMMLFNDTFHWYFWMILFNDAFHWYFSIILFNDTFQWYSSMILMSRNLRHLLWGRTASKIHVSTTNFGFIVQATGFTTCSTVCSIFPYIFSSENLKSPHFLSTFIVLKAHSDEASVPVSTMLSMADCTSVLPTTSSSCCSSSWATYTGCPASV